jgi:hypothetical protein
MIPLICKGECYIDVAIDIIRPSVEKENYLSICWASLKVGNVETGGVDIAKGFELWKLTCCHRFWI